MRTAEEVESDIDNISELINAEMNEFVVRSYQQKLDDLKSELESIQENQE
jgi:hypothetical protein